MKEKGKMGCLKPNIMRVFKISKKYLFNNDSILFLIHLNPFLYTVYRSLSSKAEALNAHSRES